MDQDRRDAAAWAREWEIKRKNRRLFTIIGVIVFIVAVVWAANYIAAIMNRSTYGSVEEMRKAMQGRYAVDQYYEDLVIEGDDITLTYLAMSHYDRSYAEKYGYDCDKDSVYTDRVVEWDYRHGVIKTAWMGDIIVDKDGNLKRSEHWIFYKTDKPRPEPIDPATLKDAEGDSGQELSEDEEKALEVREESLEETQDEAEEAGVTPETEAQPAPETNSSGEGEAA